MMQPRMWTMKMIAVVCAGWLAVGLTASMPSAWAEELVLVEDGQSVAPIVVFADAPPRTRAAAAELAEYIEKISGARPAILEGEPEDLPDRAIWVGYQPVLDSLFPEQNFEFEHPEEILIAANNNHLVIAGRDRWRPDHMVVHSRGGRITTDGIQQEYGTANAIYTFLQDYLDVRWFWPGESGIDVLEKETIAFEPFAYRYHPQIRGRDSILRFSALTWSNDPHSGDWARVQRLQLDSLETPGGHAFNDWWERFHEDHPDYFALQPDGTRSESYRNKKNVKLCQSNPAVWDQWVADVAAEIEENPTRRIFNGSPNDGYNSGICICENCRAWDHPEGAPASYTWSGLSQRYVAMSDRDVTFANKLGEKLEERFPDKDYYVLMMAYGHARPAPVEARPRHNVLMSSVHNFHLRTDAMRDENLSQFKNWPDVSQWIWRPNIGNGTTGWKMGMLDISLTQADKDYKFMAEKNCIGIFYDSAWQHWATQGPYYYLIAQLAWNPRRDSEAVMDDYYQRAFGPAADSVEAYWTLIENNRDRVAADPSISASDYRMIFTEALISQAEALLDKAASQVADGPTKYQDRVAFVRAGLDYTRLATEMSALSERYKMSEGTDTEAAEQIRARWAAVEAIREAQPHALNWFRLGVGRDRGYLWTYHPDQD